MAIEESGVAIRVIGLAAVQFRVTDDTLKEDHAESWRSPAAFAETALASRGCVRLSLVPFMGKRTGIRSAMGQIEAVLADLKSFAAEAGTDAQLLNDTQVRVSRVIRGTVDQVWRAHHDAVLMKRWLLGPDGWTMPVCEVATQVGERYLSFVITFPSKELRDMILGTGMTTGMETSYARLEREVLKAACASA